MNSSSEVAQKKKKPVGGPAFFISLIFLILLSLGNLLILPALITPESFQRLALFLIGFGIGAYLGLRFMGGHFSVLVHELKHAIVSNLVGNRSKGMFVRNDHGHFEYLYSARTAHMNSIIALAPYFFPAVTVPLLLIGALLSFAVPFIPLLLGGIGYGIDLTLSYKDLGPWQTDLTNIRGGYSVGLTYVIVMNIAIMTLLAAWICSGLSAYPLLFEGFFTLFELIFGLTPPS